MAENRRLRRIETCWRLCLINIKIRTHARLAAALPMALLCACVVGPNYHRPGLSVPDHFDSVAATQPASTGASTSQPAAIDLARWWKSFGDPALDCVIDRALASNLDVAIAATRVEEARAERTVVAAGLWPVVTASSQFPRYQRISSTLDRAHQESRSRGSMYMRQNIDKNGISGPASLYVTSPGRRPFQFLVTPDFNASSNDNLTTNIRAPLLSPNPKSRWVGRDQFIYEAGFDVAWELDVFGGIRRAMEAAQAEVEAEQESLSDVLVVLLSDVARTYAEMRGLQQRLEIARHNIDIQQRTVTLVRKRLHDGLTSSLDVALAERQLETTMSRVPGLEYGVARAQHRLSVLLDEPLASIQTIVSASQSPVTLPPDVPTGLPSDVLIARPDIRRSERELAAATARIGVATSELFPRFTLTGSFGLQTSDLRKILDADSLVWGGGPGMRWPIFEAGRIVGNVHVQEDRALEALLRYRQVLLTAIEEVDDSLAAYNSRRSEYDKLREAVESSDRAVRIAQDRYDKGLADFLNVLDSERSLYELQDQAATSKADAIVQLISLYKALGRGWQGVSGPITVATQ